jgi:hypothetical protein
VLSGIWQIKEWNIGSIHSTLLEASLSEMEYRSNKGYPACLWFPRDSRTTFSYKPPSLSATSIRFFIYNYSTFSQ